MRSMKFQSRLKMQRSMIATLVSVVTAVFSLALPNVPAAAQQSTPTKPFSVNFDVQFCDGGQFKTGAPCEGEPRPGESSDLLLLINQEEGSPLLAGGYMRSAGFRVTPGTEGANNDKVGEGNVKIGVVGIGTVGLLACVVNQSPPDPGDTATLVVILNISSTTPCDPGPAMAKAKLRVKSIGEAEYEYSLDLRAATASANAPGGTSLQLTTPLEISLTFFGTSKVNEDVSPPTPGGLPTIRFVDQPGSYELVGHFEGPGGVASDKKISYEVINPQPPKKQTNFLPIIVVIAVIVIIAILGYVLWSRRREAKSVEEWEYYEEDVYYEEDQYV
ncbi:MAG: hypothetical protein C4319_03935 [Acidimicrobiia bacterium]